MKTRYGVEGKGDLARNVSIANDHNSKRVLQLTMHLVRYLAIAHVGIAVDCIQRPQPNRTHVGMYIRSTEDARERSKTSMGKTPRYDRAGQISLSTTENVLRANRDAIPSRTGNT